MPTESQAKTMYCPMTRGNYCLASKCMAWNWSTHLILQVNTHPIDYKLRHLNSNNTYEGDRNNVEIPVELLKESAFQQPPGDGWKLEKIFFDFSDGEGWFASWTRTEDHSRLGDCRMLKPSLIGIEDCLAAIADSLENIRT
jgi:hypothetical protein